MENNTDELKLRLEATERELARVKASVAAIHYHAGRADADKVVLQSIVDECIHAVPELLEVKHA